MPVPFHYDAQVRRFLLQFARIFSNLQVEYGRSADGSEATHLTVPIRYGDSSRQAETILKENSANKIPSAPLMSFYVSSLDFARDRVMAPSYEDRAYIREREFNQDTQSYMNTQGNAFTIERPMPAPYDLGITLDIWTTNTNQKLQLLEQITPYFNPAVEIQSTDNYLDWTSLTSMELKSSSWTSRSIPRGTDEPIDIASLLFSIPIWISPPAKVTKGGVIHQIITSVYNDDGSHIDAIDNDDLLLGTRVKVTPHDYKIILLGDKVQIVPYNAIDENNVTLNPSEPHDSSVLWHGVIEEYTPMKFESGISQLRITNKHNDEEFVGVVSYNDKDDRFLNIAFDSDTLPQNTIQPIDAVINPLRIGPGVTTSKGTLPLPQAGQRYLLIESTGDISNNNVASAWEGTDGSQLIAPDNSIIEYDGVKWNMVTDPSVTNENIYVTNITTSIQYVWDNGMWKKSTDGLYQGGEWAIVF